MRSPRHVRSSALLVLASLTGCARESGPRPHLGYVEAEWTTVAAPEAGWIREQPVREGQRVEAGEVLFVLDRDAQEDALAEAEARLRQAEAQARDLETGARDPEVRALEARLDEARARRVRAVADLARVRPLVTDGVATQAHLDAAEAEAAASAAAAAGLERDVEVARLAARPAVREAATAAVRAAAAARDGARYRLEQRTVTAGVAGRVEELFLRPGERASAGAPVLALLGDGALKVRFFVPQAGLPGIAPGTTVQVVADGHPDPLTARVTRVATEAEFTPPVIYSQEARAKLVFLVEAALPAHTGLSPGLPVEIRW